MKTPQSRLVANVSIGNRDIGFVKTGLPVSVAVDSFAPGEFGYIQGELSVSARMLCHKSGESLYRFPRRWHLSSRPWNQVAAQTFKAAYGVGQHRLRSRPVINIISDMFTKQPEGEAFPLIGCQRSRLNNRLGYQGFRCRLFPTASRRSV